MSSNRPPAANLPTPSPTPRARRPELLQTLSESLRSKTGGEVVIRAGDRTGRVYVFRGRVAWVTASSLPVTLTNHLVSKGVASAADISAAFAECRRLGANFAEMLVTWGLIDRDRMRAEMLEHISRAMVHILEWGDVAALFVPSIREYKGSLTYAMAELLEAVRAMAPEQAGALAPLLEEAALDAAPAKAPTPPPPPPRMGERQRAAILEQFESIRTGAACRGICFAGDGTSCGDVLEVVTKNGAESCLSAGALLRMAGGASIKAALGTCTGLTLVGSSGVLMAWQVVGDGIGGVLIVTVDLEAQLPLTRMFVERSLETGPLKRVKTEADAASERDETAPHENHV